MSSPIRQRALPVIAALVALAAARPATAQTSDNVLLVINESSPASIQIGDYYVRQRAIAQDHVVRIKTVTTDTVQRSEFEKSIETPVGNWLLQKNLQDRVLYVVLTKGVPLRIAGTEGREGAIASVDSELTLLYRKMTGQQIPLAGRLANPYFLGEKPLSEAKPFTRFLADTYLVTRLDGFTVDDVLRLIDRGLTPVTEGRIVLDQKATLIDRGGDDWLQEAADRLRASGAGDRVVLEVTRSVAQADGPILGYYSWGSNDPANKLRRTGLQFAKGAIGATFVSTDGRTFNEPPADWAPNDTRRMGYGSQSLAGDLIRDGLTGVAAHVTEPFLDATIRPQVLFPAYLAGYNLAESFYLAMPFLSWETVVVGDPLCTPFPRKPLTAADLSKGIDPTTELPALFIERRLAVLSKGGLNLEALKLSLRAETQLRAGNKAEAEKAWIRATEIEPKFIGGHLSLASIYEERKDYSNANERYRKVLAVDPGNVIGLNNLAYSIAVNEQQPKEALPLAEKAYRATNSPVIADTLGWIHHLLGDDRAALPLVDRAVAALRDNVDILVHAAIVHGALNDFARAKAELDAADRLDLTVKDRPEVKALRARIKG
jgi:uncharacterized protein (TIGR03790 family)